jgi:hypothetical protein
MGQIELDKQQLEEILTRDLFISYTQAEENVVLRLLSNIWGWISERLPFLNWGPPSESMTMLMLIIATLVLTLCVIGIILLVYQMTKHILLEKRQPYAVELDDLALEQHYTDYMKQAQAFQATQQWRQAIRNWFLSYLFFMQENQLLKVEKWKTNGAYLQELQLTAPKEIELFSLWAQAYERAWYGQTMIDEDEATSLIYTLQQSMQQERMVSHEDRQ